MTIYYGLLPVIDIYYNRLLEKIFITNLNNCAFFCLQRLFYFKTLWMDKQPGMGAPPRGEGGFPAPPRTVGRGGFPAPTRPVKMIKTAGKLRGKIKAYI